MKSVGVVVISHEQISQNMLTAVSTIVPEPRPLFAVTCSHLDGTDMQAEAIKKAIEAADEGSGILLLTDIVGATPCNICRTFLDTGRVAMVTGFNLPMLIKLASLEQEYQQPEELAKFIQDYGKKNITIEKKSSEEGA